MKLIIKLLSNTVFITAPVLCMDPSSRSLYPGHQTRQVTPDKSPYSGVNPELSRGAGQDAERKQTQAELDKQQFLSEKDAKERAAQINGASQAATTLQSEAAKTDELIKAMQNRLPNQVFRMIGRFVPDYKIVHQNMEKLIPAIIIWWENGRLFNRITKDRNNLSNFACTLNVSGMRKNELAFIFPCDDNRIAKNAEGYAAYKFKNGQIIYKVCRNKREQLERLTVDQIKYLMMLYDLRNEKAKGEYVTSRTYFREHYLKSTQKEIELYNTLPEHIKNCLKHNYGQNMPQQMKYPAGTIVF